MDNFLLSQRSIAIFSFNYPYKKTSFAVVSHITVPLWEQQTLYSQQEHPTFNTILASDFPSDSLQAKAGIILDEQTLLVRFATPYCSAHCPWSYNSSAYSSSKTHSYKATGKGKGSFMRNRFDLS